MSSHFFTINNNVKILTNTYHQLYLREKLIEFKIQHFEIQKVSTNCSFRLCLSMRHRPDFEWMIENANISRIRIITMLQPKRTYTCKSDKLYIIKDTSKRYALLIQCVRANCWQDTFLMRHLREGLINGDWGRTQVEERQMVSALLQRDMINQPFDPTREHTAATAVQQERNRS